jgi:hypothetical protein
MGGQIHMSYCIRKFISNTGLELPKHEDGFGGLVVSMLASGSRVRGFKPKPLDF